MMARAFRHSLLVTCSLILTFGMAVCEDSAPYILGTGRNGVARSAIEAVKRRILVHARKAAARGLHTHLLLTCSDSQLMHARIGAGSRAKKFGAPQALRTSLVQPVTST